jgi:ribonuclease J
MYIISGCYGQVGSSLYRLSLGEHKSVEIHRGDTLIFSADPAPQYTKESEDFVIDNLIGMGVDVHYYDLNEDLYMSGHGSQEDILELFKIANPRYFIPIGGAIRFMHSYKNLALKYGANPEQVFELKPGESVIFENGRARPGDKIKVKSVLVHGLGIGDIGKIVLGDRDILGKEGIVVAVIKINQGNGSLVGTPTIVTRGFVFEKLQKKLITRASEKLRILLGSSERNKKDKMKRSTTVLLEKFFYKETGRRPMILPLIVEV